MTIDSCGDMQLLVQAELDGELDVAGLVALSTHVKSCAGCGAYQADMAALSARLKGGLTRYAAPASVRAAVRPAPPARLRFSALRYGGSFAAGMAMAAAVAMFIVLPSRENLVPEIVSAHIRALQPGHLVDVESTDRHTVKPWFDGRLDYAPPVRNFAEKGFALVGGRLDYVAGRPVAALVYRRDKHLIDVFVWPGNLAGADATVVGYNVIAWAKDGMMYRAVSDLNTVELGEFVSLMQAGAPAGR